MFSEKETDFMKEWALVRERESHFLSKLGRGLPMALIFSLPIILSLIVVYFLSPEWYTKISQAVSGSLTVVVIAVVITALFFSYFRMHFKWEMNEQLYLELKRREQKSGES